MSTHNLCFDEEVKKKKILLGTSLTWSYGILTL